MLLYLIIGAVILTRETTTYGEKKHLCIKCDKKYETRHHLEEHIQVRHIGAKYKSNRCDSKFKCQSVLKKHFLSKLEGLKYDCTNCDYQTTQQVH